VAEDVTPPQADEPLVGRERRSEQARRTSYRLRFGIVYVVLAAVFGAGVGAFVVLAARPEPEPDPAWSAWRPTGSPVAMVRQIADRIPKAYKTDKGQLTISTSGPLSVPIEDTDVPIRNVFVQPDTSKGLQEEADIETYAGQTIVAYALCGAGRSERCAAIRAKDSPKLDLLLRRQALELSLYTLKYVDDAESVLVFLPPTAKGEGRGTVFLTRDDVANDLERPIAEILPSRTPTVDSLSGIEEGHVLRLTSGRRYAFQFEPAPDGSPILVLNPPTQGP
jgi:hypothetical protein